MTTPACRSTVPLQSVIFGAAILLGSFVAAPAQPTAATDIRAKQLKAEVAAITLPRFEVTNVTLREAFEQLRQLARARAPRSNALNFVIVPSASAEERRFSVKLHAVTVYDAARILALKGHSLVEVTGFALKIQPATPAQLNKYLSTPKPGVAQLAERRLNALRVPTIDADKSPSDDIAYEIGYAAHLRAPNLEGLNIVTAPAPAGQAYPAVTYSMRDTPLAALVKLTAQLANLQIKYDTFGAVLYMPLDSRQASATP